MGGIWSLILMERHRYVWWNAILKMALLLSAMWNRKVVGWIFIALFLTGMVSQIGCSGEGGDNRWLHTLPVSRAQIVAAQYLLTAGRLMEVTLLLGLGSFLAQKYSFFPGVTLERALPVFRRRSLCQCAPAIPSLPWPGAWPDTVCPLPGWVICHGTFPADLCRGARPARERVDVPRGDGTPVGFRRHRMVVLH